MAGASKPEFTPLLAPGFHEMSIEELEQLCVHRFTGSVTRSDIMQNLRRVIAYLQANGMRGRVWIDGSFLTEKLNPDDVDILLEVEEADFRAMTPEQVRFFCWFRDTNLYASNRCDNYTLIRSDDAEGEWMYAYWLRQFGFSRADQMKGLAVIVIPFLVAV